METKARYTLVGLFTLLGIFLLLGAILWLGKVAADNDWRYYTVKFDESVNGLSKGSAVQYTGLKIGEVQKLYLGDNPNNVFADIKVSSDVPIKKDVQARLQIVGITGQAAIALSGGSDSSPELEGDQDNRDLIIATPSALSKILSGSDDIMSNFTQTLVGVNKLFSDENVENVKKILDNVSTVTGAVADKDNQIRDTMDGIAKLSKQVSGAVESFRGLSDSTKKMIDEQGKTITKSATDTFKSIQDSAQRLNNILADNQHKIDRGADGLQQVGPAIRDLRESVTTLQSILKKFDSNPGGYLLEGNKLREFKP